MPANTFVPGNPSFWRWVVKKCRESEYAVVSPTGALSCLLCPAGADCSHPDATLHTVLARPGFWAPSVAGPRQSFFRCMVPRSCLGGAVSGTGSTVVSRCAVEFGYRSNSTLCAVCKPGFVRDGLKCAMCGDRGWTLVGGIGVTILFCVFVYVEMSRAT